MIEDLSVLTRIASPPDQVVTYGPHPDQSADVWAGHSGTTRPLLIIVHGGFWRPQYGRDQSGPMAAALAEAGWSVAAMGYRRIPGNPDVSVEDVRRASQVLSREVHSHNGHVVLIGHSAGGHLALLAGFDSTLKLSAVLALAPTADLRLAEAQNVGNGAVSAFLGVPADSRPDLDPSRLTPICIPTHLLHGQADGIVPLDNSDSYLRTHPTASLERLPDTGHFALIDPLSSAWDHILDQLTLWSDSTR